MSEEESKKKSSLTPTFVSELLKREEKKDEQETERSREQLALMKDLFAEQSKAHESTIRKLWAAVVIQALVIAALAGVQVSGKIPFVGDIVLGDAAQAVDEGTSATAED